MIFLGAGASKFFGLKTLQDMTDDLVSKLKEKGHGKTIDDLLQALKRFGLTPDFENIYTTIEGLVDPTEGVRRSGAFTAYVAHKVGLKSIIGHPEYENLLTDFREYVYDECTIKKGIIENKGSVLEKLFKTCAEYRENRFLSSKIGLGGETRNVGVDSTLVTTNYDMAIELLDGVKGLGICDGFKTTKNDYIKKLDFGEYGRNVTSHWLIKLHGSIWQYTQGDRIIRTIGPPNDLSIEISVGNQMMIYPVGEKPILEEPFYTFYSVFKEQPWENLVVIGHSFRDKPINIAILERLRIRPPPRTKLIVVNPDAESAVRNLGQFDGSLDQRIIRINDYFRDDGLLFEKIGNAIGSKDWNEYKKRYAS